MQEVTGQAAWSTDNAAIATMDAVNIGMLDGAGPGTVNITATLGSVSGTLALTLSDAQRTGIVTDNDSGVPITVGDTRTIATYYQYADGTLEYGGATAVQWSSSDDTIVSVDSSSDGLAHGNGVGTATLTVSMGGFSTTTTLTCKPM
jgi:hypothetical protein